MTAQHKILLVDDHEDILKLEHKILTDQGYTCEIAHNGSDALEKLSAGSVHLAIRDVHMPAIDGFTVAERVQRDPKYGQPYVIFVTARADAESMSEGFATGGVLYLTKPFTRSKLLDVVKAVTEMG